MLLTDVVETVTTWSFTGAHLQTLTPICRDRTQAGCAQGWFGAEMVEILRDNPALGTTFDKKHDKDPKGYVPPSRFSSRFVEYQMCR